MKRKIGLALLVFTLTFSLTFSLAALEGEEKDSPKTSPDTKDTGDTGEDCWWASSNYLCCTSEDGVTTCDALN